MVAKKIGSFGGMVPALDDLLLPDEASAHSENTWLYTGILDGLPQPTLLRSCSVGTSKVYRIPNNYTDAIHILDADWLEFPNIDTDVLRSSVIDDTYDRYYWSSPVDVPRYNTRARIKSASAAWKLGIPSSLVAPGVSSTGGSGVAESRAYVYTWVSAYGEEGPPSPPTVHNGKVDDTWSLTFTAAAGADLGTDRNLTKTNIYRTVTSVGGITTFFFVAQIAIGTLAYSDTIADAVVSANIEIPSTTWTGPPADLAGWVSMPNGMWAGWRANEVWFCEPYRPHAWPAAYTIVVDFPIVGLGAYGQTLVVCTQGNPSLATGVKPSTITQSKLANLEPCTSRGSILSTPEGVYYASPNGLMLVSSGRAQNITKSTVTKNKWQQLINTSTLRCARIGTAYYAYGSSRPGVFEPTAFDNASFQMDDFTGSYSGVLIDPNDSRIAFNLLSNVTAATNVMNDYWTGEVFVIRGGNLYYINIADPAPILEVYTWRTKKFQRTSRKNFSAARVYFTVPAGTAAQNPVPNTSLNQTLASDQYAIMRIYADDRLVETRELRTSGDLIRFPSGFKATFWQLEFQSRVRISSLQIGETVKDLAQV